MKTLTLRMSDKLYERLKQTADAFEISVTQYIRLSIQASMQSDAKRIMATERRQNEETKDLGRRSTKGARA